MTRGSISTGEIAPDMLLLGSAFQETSGHPTLGSEYGIVPDVVPEEVTSVASLPLGTKLFVKSEGPYKENKNYDSVGIILSHSSDGVNVFTLRPKGGGPWGAHDAYDGELVSEIPDAFAALDRLFDRDSDSSSIAVLSEATGLLLGKANSPTIGIAGCSSHEKPKLRSVLSVSQIVDRYDWGGTVLLPDSDLARRDDNDEIIKVSPGKAYDDQPSRDLRDRRYMFDRILLLSTAEDSALRDNSPAAILGGLENAVSIGAFQDIDRPVSSVAGIIKSGAGRLVK